MSSKDNYGREVFQDLFSGPTKRGASRNLKLDTQEIIVIMTSIVKKRCEIRPLMAHILIGSLKEHV